MKKITKQGIYKGLSYAEYDAIPALRSTYLKRFLHCPAASQVKDEETEALRFGIAAHVGVLEGMEELKKRYAFIPKFEGDKRSGQYKTIKAATIQDAGVLDKIVLDFDDYEAIKGIRSSILSHPTASLFIGKHEPELTAVWKDKETGLICKARFDVAPYMKLRAITDLKTTVTASEGGFAREISNHGYYFSAAFYLEGASEAMKEKIDIFAIIAAEKKPPYRVEVHELSQEYIEYGNAMFHKALRKEKECQKLGMYEPFLNAGVIVQEKPGYLLVD